ncbi:MAG: Ig-like domain-containing protein [Muribaculaceae bacterium]|nr:Ig-like domain-containing protein [Muribaculaceae bacterium]
MLDLIYIQKTGDAGDDNPETPEITVALDKASVETEVGETVQLTASYLPEDAEDVVLAWSSSDEAIATVDENGLVTAIAAGECVITVALASDETVKAECTVTVKAKEENPENPEVKTLYSRTEETWTEADLEEWVNDNAQYVSQTIDGGLKMAGTNSGWNSTKEITYAENSIVTLTATLHGGAAPGRSGSYDFLKLGGAEVRMNGQDKKASVVIGETETALTGYTRDADYIITMTINQASKDVTVSVEGGAEGEATGKLAEALPNNVVVGHYKAGRENYEVVEILKAISISEELQTVTMIDYTVNYTCDGEIIKTEEGSTTAGNEVTAATTLTVDDQKYYLAEGAETVLIVTEEGENVLNVEMRKAYVFNYIVKNNVNEETMTGECVEGESATVPFSKYILAADGTVWTKGANSSNPWYGETITPDADNYEVTLEYAVATETIKAENEGEEDIVNDITNGIFFSEAENIEGMTEATGSNANIRCSNQAGGYAEEAVALYTLKPGTYKVRIGVWGNAGAEFVVKAGEETIMTAETQGYWFEAASEEFTLAEETALTFEGANASHPLDYILITGKEKSDVPTGVAALGFDSNSPVKVYDLNGRYMSDKVEGLQGGIYVIRQGNNAKKVIIK